ncbi:MAG: ABC transporter ATP-binding protein/permease [Bacteroidales bacterium]|nr:ABC transporter ATP-binding protein/permease [Bacteroidales bacterium]
MITEISFNGADVDWKIVQMLILSEMANVVIRSFCASSASVYLWPVSQQKIQLHVKQKLVEKFDTFNLNDCYNNKVYNNIEDLKRLAPNAVVTATKGTISLIEACITIISTAILLINTFGYQVTFLLFLLFPMIFCEYRFSRDCTRYVRANIEYMRREGLFFRSLFGISTLRENCLYKASSLIQKKWKEVTGILIRENSKFRHIALRSKTLYATIFYIILYGYFYFTIKEQVGDQGSVGNIYLLLVGFSRIQIATTSISNQFGSVVEHIQKAADFLDEKGENEDRSQSEPVLFGGHETTALELRDITYKYPNSIDSVLNKRNFLFHKNSITILRGPSGCGKSTILDIISGLLKPNDGIWISNFYTHKDVVYSPQNPASYNISVGGNLCFQEEGDKRKMRELIIALKIFDKDCVDIMLPKIIGNELYGGINLSYGQWKRLSFARAVYNQKPIILLDEPTIGLDEESKKEIIKRIRSLKWKSTVIIATHENELLQIADFVLDC